jgi:hypothetical protein
MASSIRRATQQSMNTWNRYYEQGKQLIEKAAGEINAEIDRLKAEFERVTGRPHGGNSTARKPTYIKTVKTMVRKKSGRRSTEEVIAHANKMGEFIHKHSKNGVPASVITEKFGPFIQPPKQFVNTRSKHKIKLVGKGNKSRYYPA